MLGQLRVNEKGQKIGPVGLEPPVGARKGRKSSLTKRRNTAPGINTPDPKFLNKSSLFINRRMDRPYLQKKNFVYKILYLFYFEKNFHLYFHVLLYQFYKVVKKIALSHILFGDHFKSRRPYFNVNLKQGFFPFF